jgi:hypothetical protein
VRERGGREAERDGKGGDFAEAESAEKGARDGAYDQNGLGTIVLLHFALFQSSHLAFPCTTRTTIIF